MATDKKLKRKADRARANRAEKIELMLWRVGIGAVVLAFFVGVGVTFVNMYKNYQATKPNYDSTEMVVGDLTGVLQATEADLQVLPAEDGEIVDAAAADDAATADEAVSEGEAVEAEPTDEAADQTAEEVTEAEAADAVAADDAAAGDAAETAEAVAAE
jgi:hypothetical protein